MSRRNSVLVFAILPLRSPLRCLLFDVLLAGKQHVFNLRVRHRSCIFNQESPLVDVLYNILVEFQT